MNEAREMTELEAIAAQIKRQGEELASLQVRQAALLAVERPAAIAQVAALIGKYNLTRAEVESPAWPKPKQRKARSDAGQPRGPRKAPAVVTSPTVQTEPTRILEPA